jgi:hypothetical protein
VAAGTSPKNLPQSSVGRFVVTMVEATSWRRTKTSRRSSAASPCRANREDGLGQGCFERPSFEFWPGHSPPGAVGRAVFREEGCWCTSGETQLCRATSPSFRRSGEEPRPCNSNRGKADEVLARDNHFGPSAEVLSYQCNSKHPMRLALVGCSCLFLPFPVGSCLIR